MGIQNLLKILKAIAHPKHLHDYSNMTLAVDGYAWLHKSVYSMRSIILDYPSSTNYLYYLQKRVEQLRSFNIKLIIVFDGNRLPMKEREEIEREKHRQALLKESDECLRRRDLEQARVKRIESIDINPGMAYHFIQLLKRMKVNYYVAPYEADVQLAYLSKMNLVDGVITEDSDILALGCKRVLLKLDYNTAMCDEILYEDIRKHKLGEFDFSGFDEDKFVSFCILCGCDYFKAKGVGSKNAYMVIRDTENYHDAFSLLKKKIPKLEIQSLESLFVKAFLTFKFQVIYCPIEQCLRYFNDMKEKSYPCMKDITDYSFLGTISDKEITRRIVFGEIDPITHQPFKPEAEADEEKVVVIKKGKWKKVNTRSIPKENDRSQSRLSLDMFKRVKSEEDIEPNTRTNTNTFIKGKYVIIEDYGITSKLPNLNEEKVYKASKDNQIFAKQKAFPKRKYDDYLKQRQPTSNKEHKKRPPQKTMKQLTFESLIASYNFTQSASSKKSESKASDAKSSIENPSKPFSKTLIKANTFTSTNSFNSTLFNSNAKEGFCGYNSKKPIAKMTEHINNTPSKHGSLLDYSASYCDSITESTKIEEQSQLQQKSLRTSKLSMFDDYLCKLPPDFEPFI